MLPESKDDFPKCLYLDQCKWIDLERAHYARADGEPFKDALAAVRRAVEAGRLIVPFCGVNFVEAMSHGNLLRRRRLAEFMVQLAGNRTMLPFTATIRWRCVTPYWPCSTLASPSAYARR